ncbi:MAG: hypothetical protein ABSD31_03030 [Candidatus Binataceae bacterium]|jgi:hypothetical protein
MFCLLSLLAYGYLQIGPPVVSSPASAAGKTAGGQLFSKILFERYKMRKDKVLASQSVGGTEIFGYQKSAMRISL